MREAQKALRHTGELTTQDAINQVEIINMVAEGIQQAMKNPPTSILDEHCQETANLAEENHNNNNNLLTHNKAINSHTFTNCTTINNSTRPSPTAPTHTTPIELSVDMAETTITTTPTTITVRVGTTESFIAGLMGAATTQVQIANQRCTAIKMRPRFKTGWEVVQEDANDG
eukprot:4763247-Ditylum_brightwellii.AAC.1